MILVTHCLLLKFLVTHGLLLKFLITQCFYWFLHFHTRFNENSAITCGAVYFHGQNEVEARQNYSSGLNPFLLMQIQSTLTDECKNPFIEQFKKAAALAKGKN